MSVCFPIRPVSPSVVDLLATPDACGYTRPGSHCLGALPRHALGDSWLCVGVGFPSVMLTLVLYLQCRLLIDCPAHNCLGALRRHAIATGACA